MELQSFDYQPVVLHNTLARRDIDSVSVFEKACNRMVEGDELASKICKISAHHYEENKEKVDSCIVNCTDLVCSVDCVLSGIGFSYKAFYDSPNVKAETECALKSNIPSCVRRCTGIQDIHCVKRCSKLSEPEVFSCLSKKINVPEEILEKRQSCLKNHCLNGDDLSNYQECFDECTTGKIEI